MKGFTLIELLISIAIMGIVFGVVLTSTSLVKKNAGDTTRQADLRSIQSALEQYHADQGFYPAQSGIYGLPFPQSQPLTNQTGNNIAPLPTLKTYLNKLPNDANTSQNYCYQAQKNSTPGSYCDNTSQVSFCEYYNLYAILDTPTGSTKYSCGGINSYNLLVTQP